MRRCISAANPVDKKKIVMLWVAARRNIRTLGQTASSDGAATKGGIGTSWKEDGVLKNRRPTSAHAKDGHLCFCDYLLSPFFFCLLLSDSLLSLRICSLCAALIRARQLRTRRPFCWEHMLVSVRGTQMRRSKAAGMRGFKQKHVYGLIPRPGTDLGC